MILVLIDKNHINPPETRDLISFKLRPKWCGPYKITEVIGKNAIRVQLPASMTKHPVFNIESTKPYPKDALERVPTTTSTTVDGEQEWYVDSIQGTVVKRNKRLWKVKWQGVDPTLIEEGNITTEPITSFRSKSGYNIHIVEYEQNRTGLIDAHEYDWSYPIGSQGVVIQQPDGHQMYTTKRSDTIESIALAHQLSKEQLRNQNVRRYGENLTINSSLKTGTQLRFPKSASQALATLMPLTKLFKIWCKQREHLVTKKPKRQNLKQQKCSQS